MALEKIQSAKQKVVLSFNNPGPKKKTTNRKKVWNYYKV